MKAILKSAQSSTFLRSVLMSALPMVALFVMLFASNLAQAGVANIGEGNKRDTIASPTNPRFSTPVQVAPALLQIPVRRGSNKPSLKEFLSKPEKPVAMNFPGEFIFRYIGSVLAPATKTEPASNKSDSKEVTEKAPLLRLFNPGILFMTMGSRGSAS